MRLYTKTGDTGETSLYGGKRVRKDASQVHAYGDIDELSAWIGVLLNQNLDAKDAAVCTDIQNNLYGCMSILSGAQLGVKGIQEHTRTLESYIDEVDAGLPELRSFLLQQGTSTSVHFHVVRTVCRRAERSVVSFVRAEETHQHAAMLQYLNRLSDLMFVLARKYNKGGKEVKAEYISE